MSDTRIEIDPSTARVRSVTYQDVTGEMITVTEGAVAPAFENIASAHRHHAHSDVADMATQTMAEIEAAIGEPPIISIQAPVTEDVMVPEEDTAEVQTVLRFLEDDSIDMKRTVGKIRSLPPERVRDALSVAYADIIGGRAGPAPSIARALHMVVSPFLTALPGLVRDHGPQNEQLRRLTAEILVILKGVYVAESKSRNNTLIIRPLRGSVTGRDLTPMQLLQMQLKMSATLERELAELASNGGFWSVFMNAHQYRQMALHSPVNLINTIAEMGTYLKAVSFKTKLDNQQLKILQAFFRTA
jgi:hypothetical protein